MSEARSQGTERSFLWEEEGGAHSIAYREGPGSDLAVLHQIFRSLEYATESWRQGRALRAYHAARAGAGGRALVLDLGAHIGVSAVYFAATFRPATVIAAEPDPGNCALLRRNGAGLDIRVEEAAIGKAEGVGRLGDPGHGAWAYRMEAGGGEGLPVRVTTPGALLARHEEAEHFPLVCKIDIEGGESDLFDGDCAWMDRFPLVVLELHDWMLPFAGSSRSFQRAVAARDFDLLQRGENLFCFHRPRLEGFLP